jgi:predicted alpha/beta-hydrolase family hydrolase
VESAPQRIEQTGLRGWLHLPAGKPTAALAITHGAGTNCEAPLIVAAARAFAAAGYAALRYDLPFRQANKPPTGAAQQQRDRDGIRQAAAALRQMAPSICLAGHSYGGRQTSMLLAEDSSLAGGLLLLSYPLHPPGQPQKLRTEHFPNLRTPTLFVHGAKDEFGTIAEIEAARALIPAPTRLRIIDRAPHSLPPSIAASLPGWFEE